MTSVVAGSVVVWRLHRPPFRAGPSWRALTDGAALAEWMYPNDFESRVGHDFTFQVPPNPKVGFDGLVVRCAVLECEAPSRPVFSWSAGVVLPILVLAGFWMWNGHVLRRLISKRSPGASDKVTAVLE